MAHDPKRFLRDLLARFDLIEALTRGPSRLSENEVWARIQEFTPRGLEEARTRRGSRPLPGNLSGNLREPRESAFASSAITPDSLVKDGFLIYVREADEYVLRSQVYAFVAFLSRSRKLTSRTLSEIYLRALHEVCDQAETHLDQKDWHRLTQDVDALGRVMGDVREAVEGNFEEICRLAGELRRNPPSGAKTRLELVRKIWEDQIEPMEGVFAPNGAVDREVRRLDHLLEHLEAQSAPLSVVLDLRVGLALARQASATAFRAHQESIRELRPIYLAAKRDSALSQAASRLAEGARRAEGWWRNLPWGSIAGTVDLMRTGEHDRNVKPFHDLALIVKLRETLHGGRSASAPSVSLQGEAEGRRAVTFDQRSLKRAIDAGGGTEDLLAWLHAEHPGATKRELARAYGLAVLFGLAKAAPGEQSQVIHQGALVTGGRLQRFGKD